MIVAGLEPTRLSFKSYLGTHSASIKRLSRPPRLTSLKNNLTRHANTGVTKSFTSLWIIRAAESAEHFMTGNQNHMGFTASFLMINAVNVQRRATAPLPPSLANTYYIVGG